MALLRVDAGLLIRVLLPGVDCEINSIQFDRDERFIFMDVVGPDVPPAKEVMAISVVKQVYDRPATIVHTELRSIGS